MIKRESSLLEHDNSPAGVAFRHYQNFYSATNPTLFDDLVNISAGDAKQIVLKLLLKKKSLFYL